MKTLLLFLLFSTISWQAASQELHLRIIGQTDLETKTIDSLKYNTEHKNIKSINYEINKLSANLSQIGYINNILPNVTMVNDSIYSAKLILGEKINWICIAIGNDKLLNSLISTNKTNTIEIPYSDVNSFLEQTIQKLEQNGYALAQLKLINIERNKNILYADLKLEIDQKRKLNSITIKYSDGYQSSNFPKGHLTQLNKKYQNTVFNRNTIEQIHNDFEKFKFVNQIKYPEILFTKDSTKVYVYLEKRNSNSFDGFLGFSNNDNKKINFTGYLDINLENILKSGEQISIYWKSDGNNQRTFKGSFELPYLFKTSLGLKTQINIFRQDSTFQNTKTAIDLSYYVNYNSRFYLGYHVTESSDIQNLNNALVSDFSNSFIKASFEYSEPDKNNDLFTLKSKIETSFGIGQRNSASLKSSPKENQYIVDFEAMHNIYLNKKNAVNLKSQFRYLQSKYYLINELFRFGGINSIRGFSENSLQSYFTAALLTEYRFILTPNFYLHTILDYLLYKNEFSKENPDKTENLIGIGIGIGLQTKNGILKLAVANGHAKKQQFKIYNTIIHLSYNVKF